MKLRYATYAFALMTLLSAGTYAKEVSFWNGCDYTYKFNTSKSGDEEILNMRIHDHGFISEVQNDFNMQGWSSHGSPYTNDNIYSLILNALYVLYKAGDGSDRGMLIKASYKQSADWIKKLSPVCSFSKFENIVSVCHDENAGMCSRGSYSDFFGANANSVEVKASAVTSYNVVDRAATLYHEAMHAMLAKDSHGGFGDGDVAGRHLMWLIWFAGDANPEFSDHLRMLASNTANWRFDHYGISDFEMSPNVAPRKEVYSSGSWWEFPQYKPDDPQGTTTYMLDNYSCYMSYGNKVESWNPTPSPGVCYVRN
ncbi:hypothetical protein [Marinimicrobium sp. C2-29]|uniref:hypothetical protein n=1 Tax=Marinimicrobium sp. C2-29 TaxID=3139825 RepID=UPI0031394F55